MTQQKKSNTITVRLTKENVDMIEKEISRGKAKTISGFITALLQKYYDDHFGEKHAVNRFKGVNNG